MRYYGFGNYYLSQIQQGIQAAHTIADILVSNPGDEIAIEWAKHHSTIILLNGGNNARLQEIEDLFLEPNHTYPWSSFREDEQSLNSTLTNVGIIVPEKIYEASTALSKRQTSLEELEETGWFYLDEQGSIVDTSGYGWTYTNWELRLIVLLASSRLV